MKQGLNYSKALLGLFDKSETAAAVIAAVEVRMVGRTEKQRKYEAAAAAAAAKIVEGGVK